MVVVSESNQGCCKLGWLWLGICFNANGIFAGLGAVTGLGTIGPILGVSCISIRVEWKNVPLENEKNVPFFSWKWKTIWPFFS